MRRAGSMREQISVESRVTARGEQGGMVEAWSTLLASVSAEVRTYSGEEKAATASGGQLPIARTEFRMDWRESVTPACRIQWKGRTYNIRSIAGTPGVWPMIVVADTGANDGR